MVTHAERPPAPEAERTMSDGAAVTSAEPSPDEAGPALAVAAVARRLGVAPATLRTWDRRYGLGPSEHSAGSHRRYSPADVERLVVMRRLTLDGVAPADAARAAMSPTVPSVTVTPAPADVSPSMLVDAALVDDAATCARLLALDPSTSVADWWTSRVGPALADLRRRVVLDRPGSDAVRTLEGAAVDALRANRVPLPRGAGVVLVLVPSGQERPLVAHALAAALAAGGVDARVVGGPARGAHTAELVTMTRARAVVTICTSGAPDLAVVEHLAEQRPDVPQFVMVPDAAAADLPLGHAVHRARSFTGLLHETLAVAAA
ncbi:MerR family transcriptional regulator [Cellulomonas sp. HZM]|uniref:MerR family transcriptional regulator n=1 Tax=Cellulomonas sp. HZM TaxID=1454010 RepID=UPI001E4703A3|nr:MerR family transcriptional regulator [Cellulomonas sp. HZM]